MINNEFRKQLEKIVVFIFDNEKEFIKQFILKLLEKELRKKHLSIKNARNKELENVLLSNSKVFIRIKYTYDYDEKNSLSYEKMDFFLDSDEVFNWVCDK